MLICVGISYAISYRVFCLARDVSKAEVPGGEAAGDGAFFVLALSQGSVRLFEGSRDGIRELDLADIPTSLRDAVGYDYEQRSLQFHTGAGAGDWAAAWKGNPPLGRAGFGR